MDSRERAHQTLFALGLKSSEDRVASLAAAMDAHAAERVREALERAAEVAVPMCLGRCGLPTCTGDRIRALLKEMSNG